MKKLHQQLLLSVLSAVVCGLTRASSSYDSFLNDITEEDLKKLLNSTHQSLLQATHRPDYDTTSAPSSVNPNWMSRIPDSVPLSALSIPGTHNSMSLYGGPWAECQTWSLLDIYRSGVRYVDIRCRHFNDQLPVHHGIMYQNHGFQYALQETLKFLASNPTETILMRVKEEYKAENNKKRFEDVVEEFLKEYVPSGMLWDQRYLPNLGEARGKLVVLRDFVDWRWVHYRLLSISDVYDVPSLFHIGQKWDSCKEQLEKAKQGPDYRGFLTYTSGSSALALPSSVASRMNDRLWNYLKERPGKTRWGIIAMDFPGVGLIDLIIKSNF